MTRSLLPDDHDEQHMRLPGRILEPLKPCELSPMDLESCRRWEACTEAKEAMLERTHIPEAPWWLVQAVELPARVRNPDYLRQPVPATMLVPERY